MFKYLVMLLVVLLYSCQNAKKVDVSDIEVDIKWIRTESTLNNLTDTFSINQEINQHPAFYKLYFNEIISAYRSGNKDSLLLGVKHFTKDSLTQILISKINERYGNIGPLKTQVDDLYRHFIHYFPDQTDIPNIYTFISEFEYQMFLFEDDGGKDGIGLGLDMFMSPDVDYKTINPDNTSFSDYITQFWTADHICHKIAEMQLLDIMGEAEGHQMLDQMIHNGKTMYFTQLLMPDAPEHIIMEYTPEQMTWCQDNELQIWSFFLDEKLFYESNPTKINKYIYPSPLSPNMPEEAPGRTANFIGWKIVQAYMDKFPNTTISELILDTDSQKILEKSKYKPKRK